MSLPRNVYRMRAIGTVALIASGLTACELGLPMPSNPGTIVVSVTDQDGRGVGGVWITVGDIPNKVGSVYSTAQQTAVWGGVAFDYIDAGLRRVTMTVPDGFSPDPEGSERQIEVVHKATVSVDFRIMRR